MTSGTALQIPGLVAGTWDIDPAHTDVGFVVRHMVVTKVRGRFDNVRGEIVTAQNPLESSVDIAIDLTSVSTNNKQRDDHLRSPDFFEVETHPEMTYQATGARQEGDGYVLDGELTLKGVTRAVPLAFELNGFMTDPWGSTRAGFTGTAQINRKDFDVNFDGVQNGVAVVADKIDIHIEVEAVLRQPENA